MVRESKFCAPVRVIHTIYIVLNHVAKSDLCIDSNHIHNVFCFHIIHGFFYCYKIPLASEKQILIMFVRDH